MHTTTQHKLIRYDVVETIIDLQGVYALTTESLATLGGVFVEIGRKWTGWDLNPWLPACKAGDLPLIYRPPTNQGPTAIQYFLIYFVY